MGKQKFLHNPVKEGMCTVCHQAVADPQKKAKHPGNLVITLALKGSELCGQCHEAKNTKKVVHAPAKDGDCTSCHDPHGSQNKGMLKEAVPALCFQCHPDSLVKQKVMHPPVAGGDCSGCHDNHQSDNPGRLVAAGNALCFQCHPDKESGIASKKSVHPPVKESCVQCHSPHGSSSPAMMSAPVPELCGGCHPNEINSLQRALVKHGPMSDQKSCKNCHDPHFSDTPKLLLAKEMDLCLNCHNRELETGNGTVKDMKAWIGANKNTHGPIQAGDCVSCHNPHGSDFWRILVKFYPGEFYTGYAEGKYALCFSCHDAAAFSERRTLTATGFRDGDRNLHALHVNKMAKGRTCRACHDVHADSGTGHHIRRTVVFSGWDMPLNYAPSKNGGSCAPGCHGEKRYSRE
ncbi:MAG: cytochrome c3 family protein [Nitrospiraceae bacterium]|nr:cytochrome c3 family protein [Nitrospiraceae bacterium]